MKQRAHAWVAMRALKLIDDSGEAPKMVELLSYYLSDVWEGAWLPDTLIRDMSYGHIFKMDAAQEERRRVPYRELKKTLAGKRLCLEYVKESEELNRPYWIKEEISGHLPDRVIAINHGIVDMLKMGDFPLAFYLKGRLPKSYLADLSAQKIKDLSLSPNFSARQIAIAFFLISHYICDAHMPLHCDLRDYGSGSKRRLSKDLHPTIEARWEEYFPDKEKITIHRYTKESLDKVVVENLPKRSPIAVDREKEYRLSGKIVLPRQNEYDEMANVCRVSYAVSREWIKEDARNVDALVRKTGREEFERVTNYIFHDAVEEAARLWFRAWKIFTK